MAKYLAKVKYTAPQGIEGLLKGGGSARVKAATELIESLGGKVESFYFALGDVDAYVTLDMPDAASGVAASLTVGAGGGATTEIVQLITAAEVDEAAKKSPVYRAPGQ
jgi:uncharacterized protein with GYD domain